MWSLDDLDDEYGTMRTGSGFCLGVAKATMVLRVKGMPAAKRKRLTNIMGALFEDEEEDKSSDAKAPRLTSPKIVIPAAEVSGSKGGTEIEAPKDVTLSEDNRSA